MPFQVSVVDGAPNLDSLPVAKITDYPLEPADYKPFAQARMCVCTAGLLLQLWAFEANPSPKSSLKAVLWSPADPRRGFSLELWSSGQLQASMIQDGVISPMADAGLRLPTLEPLWGEDLQGIYWGGSLTLSHEQMTSLLGDGCLSPGSVLPGNLYKLSTDPVKPHCGSLFPADFAGGDPMGSSSMGEFRIVSY